MRVTAKLGYKPKGISPISLADVERFEFGLDLKKLIAIFTTEALPYRPLGTDPSPDHDPSLKIVYPTPNTQHPTPNSPKPGLCHPEAKHQIFN